MLWDIYVFSSKPLTHTHKMKVNLPVRGSFLILNVSTKGVVIPSIVPNMLPSPKFTNMRKNITDQNGDAGKCVIASVNAIKAKPVPWTDCREKKVLRWNMLSSNSQVMLPIKSSNLHRIPIKFQ